MTEKPFDIHELLASRRPFFTTAYESLSQGKIKVKPEDFVVDELFEWNFKNSGEHLYCKIKKTNLNTAEAIKLIAKSTSCRARDIGYAGLKDKRAITSQWISVPVKESDISSELLEINNIEIMESHRHDRKLRQGQSLGNRFEINVQDIQVNRETLEKRCSEISLGGFPNYYGSQRFGLQFKNLRKAVSLLLSNNMKQLTKRNGFYLSCLRSFLFNVILSERVKLKNWNTYIDGDLMQLSGTHSVFCSESNDDKIKSRFDSGDIQPVGPLWGSARILPGELAVEIENETLNAYSIIVKNFKLLKVKAGYRPYCAKPKNLKILDIQANSCRLEFELAPGQYATELLSQLFNLEES